MGKKKSAAAAAEDVPEKERLRREWQKEKQREAIAAKQAGEEFINPTKKKRKPLAARRLEARKMKRKQESNAARRAVQKEVKKQKAAAPGVVIVPIYWKGEAKQMAKVISACADAEAALQNCGRTVMLDTSHKYTPGQKFAHWEHKGVMLRVEVGPKEAERGCCTLARTFIAGHPAHRKTKVKLDPATLADELDEVAQMEAPAGLEEEYGKPVADVAPVEEPMEPPVRARASRGGDDLEDDWAASTAAEPTQGSEEEEDDDEDDEDDEAGMDDGVLKLKAPAAAKRKAPDKSTSKKGAASGERPRKSRVVTF